MLKRRSKNAAITKRKTTEPLTLTEAIDALKRELQEGLKRRDVAPLFEVMEATVEIGVAFDRTLDVQGGVNILVTNVGAKGSERTSATHKVSLKLRLLPEEEAERLVQSGEAVRSPRYRGDGND